jgi:signal transduction histidine kinase
VRPRLVPAVPAPQTRPVGGGLRRDRQAWTTHAVVTVLLVVYVAILYLAAVLAGRAFLGVSTGAGPALTVLAAAVAALTLGPLGNWLRRRLPVPPQDRLTRLARGAVAADDLPEVLSNTARLVQEGLGAASVEITTAGTSMSAAAAGRRSEALLDRSETAHVIPLARSGTLLGRLRVAMPAGVGVSPRERVLLANVAQHVATILQTAVLRDALRATVAEAELRAGDLRASRERLVLASQQGRRRVERDIHDGAQQHLVALAVHLGLLRSLVAERSSAPPEDVEAPTIETAAIATARTAARSALAAVEELSQGLYPGRLADHGLVAALEQAVRSGPLQVTVHGQDLRRVDPDVEAAVYFCCLEALQNAVKHARASRVDVHLEVRDGALTFTVSDDGHGFVPPVASTATGTGAGMQNMRDRLEAIAGALAVTSAPGAGTRVSGVVPIRGLPGGRRLPAPRSAPPSPAGS